MDRKIVVISILCMFLLTSVTTFSSAISIVENKLDAGKSKKIETMGDMVTVWGYTYYGLIYNKMTPLSDVEVKAISLDDEILDVSYTDKNGRWEVDNLPVRRTFQIKFYHDDYHYLYNNNNNFIFFRSGVFGPYDIYMLEKRGRNLDIHSRIVIKPLQNQLLFRLLEQYPNAFPLLRDILKI
jgi:hypothetical protein